MEYTHLGRTGLSVSRVVLGTMNFGPQTSEADSHAIMDAAHDAGRQLLRHGQRLRLDDGPGRAPRRSSAAGSRRAAGAARRPCSPPSSTATWATGPNDGKLSALNIRRALDASLKRLQTDYIDLYQFHHVDRDTPWDEIWQAIEVAVQQGKILYAGSRATSPAGTSPRRRRPRRRGTSPACVSEQSIYNLLARDVELEVLPAAQALRARRHPLVAAAGRAARRRARQGGATGSVAATAAPPRRSRSTARSSSSTRTFADELGHEPGELALAWLLHQPAVTGPIIGPRTMEQLDIGRRGGRHHARRRTPWPGSTRSSPATSTAPEDYAW